jgi:hypothetical protein
VVLPLKALMLKDNFASGAVSAAAEKSWVKGIL